MVEKREYDEMPDRKFLFKRGGVWTIRFRLPKRFGGGLFQRSLGTGDITTARKWRDMYVAPFLAGENLFDATQALLDHAIQQGLTQDKRFEHFQQGRSIQSDTEGEAATLRALVNRYLAHVGQGDLTPATLQSYNSRLTGFLGIVGEDRMAESIQKADITAYRDRLLKLPVNWMRLKELPPPTQQVSPRLPITSVAGQSSSTSWSTMRESR